MYDISSDMLFDMRFGMLQALRIGTVVILMLEKKKKSEIMAICWSD